MVYTSNFMFGWPDPKWVSTNHSMQYLYILLCITVTLLGDLGYIPHHPNRLQVHQ